MSTEYPKTHPLWNRDNTWIATRASIAVTRAEKVPHGADQVMISAVGLAAMLHMAKADVARADRAEARIKELEEHIADVDVEDTP